jgi:hypothetical protein
VASFPGQKGTGPPLPNPVTGLIAVVVSAAQVNLSWAIVSNATSYNVLRGGVLISSPVVPALSDTTVSANTTYLYTVQGVNSNGVGAPSAPVSATTPPAQVTGLTATVLSSSSIRLDWNATSGANTYTVDRGGSPVGTAGANSFTDTGLAPSTSYTYAVAANGAGGQGAFSSPASATTQAASGGTIIFNPHGSGFGGTVGNIGGASQFTASGANADWLTQMTSLDNDNSVVMADGTHPIKHIKVVVSWQLLFPVTQGDWANSQGIGLLTTLFNNVAALNHGPYTVSVECNSVGNTFGTVSSGDAKNMIPLWWYNNATYGPVGGNNYGGVSWRTSPAYGPNLRIDNANVLSEMVSVMSAIYTALEAAGHHIYIFNPFQELSLGAAGWINMGLTDTSFKTANAVFAANLRAAMPKSMLAVDLTYPSQSGMPGVPAMLETFLPNKWSCSNYDACNPNVPSDITSTQALPRIAQGDLAFCGQNTLNGSVVTKNYKALGYDFQCDSCTDELGLRNAPHSVLPAQIGSGRIPDVLTNDTYCGSSHHFFQWANNGPPCNANSGGSGPANYAVNGVTVTASNLAAYLAQIGVGALNPTRPSTFGTGGTLAAPANLRWINQGGPNNFDSGHPSSSSSTNAIQWDPVTTGTGYNVYRSKNGGAFTLLATNVQPQTFVGSIALGPGGIGGRLTVTTDNTGGKIFPGTVLDGNAGVTAETTISDRYTGGNQNGTTTGTGGTGTYPLNIPQTLSSRTFTVCMFIDTTATNSNNDLYTGPNDIYDYNVSTLNAAGEGPQTTNITMWGYRNGYTLWHGLQSLPHGEEVSFGMPNSFYNSTNGNPQGGPFCWEYTVNQGLQPGTDTPQVPEWTLETGWAGYMMFDFNPGAAYTGWPLDGMGSVSRVPPGDVFGKLPQFDALAYAQGAVAANTWVTVKIPMGVFGMTRNSFTGSISNGSGGAGSTCSVTAVGGGLFGGAGTFDNSGYITGTGIPAGSWVNSNLTLGTGPGGSGPGSTWQILNGTGAGTPVSVNVTSDGTWAYSRTSLYKFPLYTRSGPTQQSFLNNLRFSRT